jgi:hypothetical protein
MGRAVARTNGKRPTEGAQSKRTRAPPTQRVEDKDGYWLKSLRVAAEPAGMPACSSFA